MRRPLDGSTWRSVPVRFWTTEAAEGNRGGRRTGEPEAAEENRGGRRVGEPGKTEVLTKGVRYTATRGAESMRQAEESRPPKGSPAPPERS